MARNEALSDQEMAVCLLQAYHTAWSEYIGGVSSYIVGVKIRGDPSSSLIIVADFLVVPQRELCNGILFAVIGETKIHSSALNACTSTGTDDSVVDVGIVGSKGRCSTGALRYECHNEFHQSWS